MMKIRKFLIFAFLTLGLIYSSLLWADDFIPEYNILEGTVFIPQIHLSDGRLLGPFELILNDDEEFKLSDRVKFSSLPLSQLSETTPSVSADLRVVNFPSVKANLAGVVFSMSAILESQAGLFCFKLKSFKPLSATIPVSGSGTSNDGGGEYLVVDGSTITITPQKIDWDLAIQIQNLEGHNEGSVKVSTPVNALGEYQFSEPGVAGTLNAFEDTGQIETVTNAFAMYTFNDDGSLKGMILKGHHSGDQEFNYTISDEGFFVVSEFLGIEF